MKQELTQVLRIAFREEGENWNAYAALPNTMQGALLIGSIKITATQYGHAKQLFMDCMREVVSGIIAERVGTSPQWKKPHAAPEHERSGKA